MAVRSGLKGKDYGKGRWTQTQLKRRLDQEKKQKASFIYKLMTKNKSRQMGTKGKVAKQNTKVSKIKVQIKHGKNNAKKKKNPKHTKQGTGA